MHHSCLRRRRQLFACAKQSKSNSSSFTRRKCWSAVSNQLREGKAVPETQSSTSQAASVEAIPTSSESTLLKWVFAVWEGHTSSTPVPSKDTVWYNCKKKGHFSEQCLSKSLKEATKVSEISTTEDPSVAYLSTIDTREETSWLTTFAVNSEPMKFKVDTGAKVTYWGILRHATGCPLRFFVVPTGHP